MSDDVSRTDGEEHVNPERMEQALENTRKLQEVAVRMVDRAIASVAAEKGRTVEEQEKRMGDRFRYAAAEQNPEQLQLDDLGPEGSA